MLGNLWTESLKYSSSSNNSEGTKEQEQELKTQYVSENEQSDNKNNL